jgi:hypothetical protein
MCLAPALASPALGPAQALYTACGFAGYTLDPAAGHALFWQKALG